ncbi:MAG: alpha-amylase family glycosyl hydrolase [Spirochaetia bacterium]|jgi:glycosidase|nr:alpha-amylase family glycosyl hydrolase [Spirochaetia bacterium]
MKSCIYEDEAIYQIYLRNFTDQGTFAAAIPRLPEIAGLGFQWILLTPIHPIGRAARKGGLGSPYAIADYEAVDPELGTMDDFLDFTAEAHALGLKVLMDVVFNHCAPDSVLAREHPEYFMLEGQAPAAQRGELEQPPQGSRLGRKCEYWSDVADFDFSSSPALWMELVSVLQFWRDKGIDGFRCDVASMVPIAFWKHARQKLNQYDPGSRRELHPLLWIAESVQPSFLRSLRQRGFGAWSEPELHAVFDLSYDYDGWERLEKVWAGSLPASAYLDYLQVQESLYPAGALKLRFIENHDQKRAAARFVTPSRLRAWTLAIFFLPGIILAYMGQEAALEHRPSLFDKDPLDRAEGDETFRLWFGALMKALKGIKRNAPFFSYRELARGVFIMERRIWPADARPKYAALVNLEGWNRPVSLPEPLAGRELLSGDSVDYGEQALLFEEPVIVEL